MKTKREVLETYKEYGSCAGIDCKECPYKKVGERCDIEHNLVKLGATRILDIRDRVDIGMNGRIEELKVALLKCANENEDIIYLAGQVDISSICKDAKNTIERLEKENKQLKAQIEKMKCCGNCKLRGAECVALEYQGILCGKTRDKWELAE